MNPHIPSALRTWFIIHFITDILFAIPLFFFPYEFLKLFEWDAIDPIASRIVAAALFAIGTESWIARNANLETYINMLNLKIIWSAAVIIGIALSIYKTPRSTTIYESLLLAIFLFFNIVWIYWRVKIKPINS